MRTFDYLPDSTEVAT